MRSWASRLPLGNVEGPTAARIVELAEPIIADAGVSLASMLGRSHEPRIADARHRLFVAMWKDGFSLSEIGRLLDRNHSTVISGIRKTMTAAEYKLAQVDRALTRARAS